MPDNPSGVYSLPPSYKVANGALTDASQHNPPFEDVEQALSNRLHRDGRTSWTGDQNANGKRLTNLADAVDDQDAATLAQLNDMGTAIGDGKWSVRDLGGNWLRRNGALYNAVDYPNLAALLPALPDGVLWETKTSGTTAAIRDVVWDGLRYLGVGLTSVISSDTGADWLLRATIPDSVLGGVAFGANIYVAADIAAGKVFTSPDGDTWSAAATLNASGLFGVCYSQSLGIFIVVGGDGYIATSDDGINWISRTSGVSGFLNRVRDLNGTLIAVGNGGVILTSTDGINWTQRVSGVTDALQDVAFDGTTYIAVGNTGRILSSTSLSTWTPRTSGVSSHLRVALASSAGFLAAGASGIVRISTNVISWSASATGITGNFEGGIVDPADASRYILTGPTQTVFVGLRTSPTQFRVPNDDPTYGWIRAK